MAKTKKVWIPPITNKRLVELTRRIRPLIRMAEAVVLDEETGEEKKVLRSNPNGKLHYIVKVNARHTSYIWNPQAAEKAPGNLQKVMDITTHHSFGYPGCFKPSIAEVLAQIPANVVDQVVAFEMIEKPEAAEDLNKEKEALNAGYHVAKVRLYRLAA